MVHQSPEASMQMVFGSSPVGQLVSAISSSSSSDLNVGVHSPSLLSGQGYLLGRLAHGASWPILVKTLSTLLDSNNAMEW